MHHRKALLTMALLPMALFPMALLTTAPLYYGATYYGATYYGHLRVLPHATGTRHGGGAIASRCVSSKRDAWVIKQPPGRGDNQVTKTARREMTGSSLLAMALPTMALPTMTLLTMAHVR